MRFKNIAHWNLKPEKARNLQKHLKRKIRLKRFQAEPGLVAGADVAFKKNKAIGAVVVLSLPDFKIIEQVRKTKRVTYPYIPGLLTFREGPVLERCFESLKSKPDVIIFDGQGIAHPRNMGIATHMGILLDRPTIGCAKTWLFGRYAEPPKLRGRFSYLLDRKNRIGAVLRTKEGVKPIFVSPGHRIDIADSIRIVFLCIKRFRLPEPIRLAHHLAKQ